MTEISRRQALGLAAAAAAAPALGRSVGGPDMGTRPTPTHLYSLSGGRTTSGIVVVSQFDPVRDVGKSVDLAVSTSAAMTSPVLVGAQTVDADGLTRHVVTGKTAGTRYYCREVSDGTYFGQAMSWPTAPPQAGGWTEKWVLGSCLANGAAQAISIALDDAAGWVPDGYYECGDRGYWGQEIEPYPIETYTADLQKHMDEHANYPARRALEHIVSLDGDTDSDHEFHACGDGERGAFGCMHSVREMPGFKKLMPVRVWGDPTGNKHRGYYYDLTPHVRVVVSDFRSPERNNASDPEGPLKGMWGAPWDVDANGQEAWLFNTAFNVGTGVAVIFLNETSWWRDPPPFTDHGDKPAAYPNAQNRFVRRLGATGEFAGMSNILSRFVWFGGDRHYCGVVTAAASADGFAQVIGSGWGKECLALAPGEIMSWTTPTQTSGMYSEQFDVAHYMRITATYSTSPRQLALSCRARMALNTHRIVNDGVTTAGSVTVTSATAAFTTTDEHRILNGLSTVPADLFPKDTRIVTRNSATSVTMDAPAFASATGAKLTISQAQSGWTMGDYPSGGPTIITLSLP